MHVGLCIIVHGSIFLSNRRKIVLTVQDMIDKLQQCNRDMIIVTDDDYDNFGDPERYIELPSICTIWLRKDHYMAGCGKVWYGMSRTEPKDSDNYMKVLWIR